jgi:hypothetical protein
MKEREEAERDFGIKRAKFKELFLQKESKYGDHITIGVWDMRLDTK